MMLLLLSECEVLSVGNTECFSMAEGFCSSTATRMRKGKWHIISKILCYLSHPLQKCNVACFGIPSVMSTCVLKQATHIFDGFGSIGVPHWQHNLKTRIIIPVIQNVTYTFQYTVDKNKILLSM